MPCYKLITSLLATFDYLGKAKNVATLSSDDETLSGSQELYLCQTPEKPFRVDEFRPTISRLTPRSFPESFLRNNGGL